MKNNTIIILTIGLLINVSVFGQFRPGDIGYSSSEKEIYKNNKVKTQTQIMLDEDSITARVSVSEYTEDGWLIRTTFDNGELGYEEEQIDTLKDEYTYFPDGRIRIITMFGYDMFPIEIGYEYDNKKKLINSIVASAEAREYSYTYNKQGQIIERVGKSARWEVDAEGNSTDKLVMVESDKNIYKWDDIGHLIEDTFIMWDEIYNRVNYTYNGKDQLSEMQVFYDTAPGSIPAFKTTFYYSDNGLLKKSITVEDGFRVEHYYEYTFF